MNLFFNNDSITETSGHIDHMDLNLSCPVLGFVMITCEFFLLLFEKFYKYNQGLST